MERLIKKLKGRRLGVLYILKMVPKRLWDWKPQPNSRSTAELANHLAATPMILCDAFHGKIPDAETYETLEKEHMVDSPKRLVKLYEEGLSKLLSYLKKHVSDAHDEKIQFFYHEKKSSIYDEVFDEMGHQWFQGNKRCCYQH